MNTDSDTPFFNLDLLRGWQRSQLKLLKEFTLHDFIDQTRLSGASGLPCGSHAIGGRITPLVRANLIKKAGRDDDRNFVWQLNEETVDKKTLQNLLDEMKI